MFTSTGWSAITNTGPAPIVSGPIVISHSASPWIKVWFASAELGAASAIRVTGVQDQVVQVLDAAAFAAWSGTSAYFNGNTVVVELVVAPGDTASAFISGFDTGFDVTPTPDTICGATDDRVPSTERRVGRLLNANLNALCSGGLVSANSCYLTAGHCVTSGTVFTVEFNCPPSTPGGAIVHPGPEDQYPLIHATMMSQSGGVGLDYALARLSHNTTTGLPASLVQGHYAISSSLPPVGTLTRITGFGSASGVLNLANKTHTGNLSLSGGGTGGTQLGYTVDTTGGNSGSSVVRESDQTVFGIHTHGGCNVSGGTNKGTAITYAPIQAHYALTCVPNPPGYSISLTQLSAGSPILLTVANAPPSSELFNIVSHTPATPTNGGPLVGLSILQDELFPQISLPLGVEPFHVLANAAGGYSLSVPTVAPGVAVNVDIVSVAFTPGAGFAGYLGRSPAINATVSL
jgi:hypothetical protein